MVGGCDGWPRTTSFAAIAESQWGDRLILRGSHSRKLGWGTWPANPAIWTGWSIRRRSDRLMAGAVDCGTDWSRPSSRGPPRTESTWTPVPSPWTTSGRTSGPRVGEWCSRGPQRGSRRGAVQVDVVFRESPGRADRRTLAIPPAGQARLRPGRRSRAGESLAWKSCG